MSILNINKRTVSPTNRNGRVDNSQTKSSSSTPSSSVYEFGNGIKQNGSAVSMSGKYTGYTENIGTYKITGGTVTTGATFEDWEFTPYVSGYTGYTAEITGNVKIDGELDVTGNIKASKDVIAFYQTQFNEDALALLSATQPIFKTGSTIYLKYSNQFDVIAGELSIKDSVLTGGTASSIDWNNITNKPSTFTPSTHTHSDYSLTGHTHAYSGLTGLPDLNAYALTGHTHEELTNNPFYVSGSTIYGNTGLNLHIDGDITASGEVAAFITQAVSSDVFNNLTTVYPIYKTGSTIGFNYNSNQFEVANNALQIKDNVVAPATHTHTQSDITDLHEHLNLSVLSGITSGNTSNWTEAYNKLTGVTVSSSGFTFNNDVHISGDITASGDVVSFITQAVSGDVFNNLSVSSPLEKSGSNISLNTSNFVMNDSDSYTNSAKVSQIITLSQAEYDAIVSKNNNTMYIIL